jgi:hypothetical protein
MESFGMLHGNSTQVDLEKLKSQIETEITRKLEDFRNGRKTEQTEMIYEEVLRLRGEFSLLNGRVRVCEQQISFIQGVGKTLAWVYGCIIAFVGALTAIFIKMKGG